MDSMKELEKQAARLLGELAELRRKNRLLKARVKKLEKAAEVAGGSSPAAANQAELERRVRHLVHRLEQLSAE